MTGTLKPTIELEKTGPAYLWHRHVLLTDFAKHVLNVTDQLKDAVVSESPKLGRMRPPRR